MRVLVRVTVRVLRRGEQSGNPRDHAILITLYQTGLRVSELCDPRVGDVETSERKGSLTVRTGKGMKQRGVPLTNAVRKAVARYLSGRRSPDPSGYLVISHRTGSRLTAKVVRDIAAKYGYQAQVEDAHPHAFRHGFATELVRKGALLPTVGALLGHESLQSTVRDIQPSERDPRAAVETLALSPER